MKNKIKIIWFILKYGYEKFFYKNFKMYAPSVAGNQEVKGKITIENINFLFPMISLLISKLLFKEKIFNSRSFCKNRSGLNNANKLKKLFNLYGSDKSKYHDYHYIYSSIFKNPIKVKKILEIGIGTNNTTVLSNMGEAGKPGASLKAYRDFFKKSKIYGADIDNQILFKDDRINTYHVDQTKEKSLKKLFKLLGNGFDLIIDDGLHSHTANLNVIINCLQFLKKGGCLVIEDISLNSKSIWETISFVTRFKYKSNLIKAKNSYVFLIFK